MNTNPAFKFTVEDFKRELELGPYAWPGGYPRYFVMEDGEAMSFDFAKENLKLLCEAIEDESRNCWKIIAVDVNWEDPDLYCCSTNKRLESAYAEDEAPPKDEEEEE